MTIPRWKEVKPLLELLGYEFDTQNFSRPNGNPQKYSDAIEGEDYFTNLQDFRRFLCMHGVDYRGRVPWDKTKEAEKHTAAVTRWVRYSIVSSIRDAAPKKKTCPYFKISPTTAQFILESHKVMQVRASKWSLPWTTHAVSGDLKDIQKYLGEHGIPEEFASKMGSNQRAALQFYLADQYEKDQTTL